MGGVSTPVPAPRPSTFTLCMAPPQRGLSLHALGSKQKGRRGEGGGETTSVDWSLSLAFSSCLTLSVLSYSRPVLPCQSCPVSSVLSHPPPSALTLCMAPPHRGLSLHALGSKQKGREGERPLRLPGLCPAQTCPVYSLLCQVTSPALRFNPVHGSPHRRV